MSDELKINKSDLNRLECPRCGTCLPILPDLALQMSLELKQARIAYLEEQLRWRPVSEKPIMNGKYEVKHMTIKGDAWVEIEFYPGGSWNSPIFDHVMWRPIPRLDTKGGER